MSGSNDKASNVASLVLKALIYYNMVARFQVVPSANLNCCTGLYSDAALLLTKKPLMVTLSVVPAMDSSRLS